MNPHDLFRVVSPDELPAPYWFIELFKVLGFTLHMAFMNLWFAGLPLAAWLHWRGNDSGRKLGGRLVLQMPTIIALGVNFGIIPLLFMQAAYFRAFYPATILMAWFWMGVIALLLPAYYGAYAYAYGLRGQLTPWRCWAGCIAVVLFPTIGFLFANALTLMTNIRAWPELFARHSLDGAALGTALNLGDPTLLPRWLLMFGLALGSTAAWAVIDTAWFAGPASPEYAGWTRRFARRLYTASFLVTAGAGAWYVFGAWSAPLRSAMFAFPTIAISVLAAVAPALPAVWLFVRGDRPFSRPAATALGVLQFAVLGVNAIGRQIAQNLELKEFLDVASQPVNAQWGPLVAFLLLFVLGVGVVIWMLAQIAKAEPAK